MVAKKYHYSRLIIATLRSGSRLILVVGFLSSLILVASTGPAQARLDLATPSFKVKTLFEGYYRDGDWASFEIKMRNGPQPWHGQVRTTLSYTPGNDYTFNRAVDLAANEESDFFFYMLPTRYEPRFEIKLYDANGEVVGNEAVQLQPISKADHIVGVLTDPQKAELPRPGIIKYRQNDARTIFVPADPPDRSDAFNTLDAILIGNLAQTQLTAAQWRTITGWVEEGGRLWLSGGPAFSKLSQTLDPLLLAARSQGTIELSRLSAHNLPDTVLPDLQLATTIQVQRLATEAGSQVAVLADSGPLEGLPLVVSRPLGRGSIVTTAFDLLSPPFVAPDGANSFWGSIAEAADLAPDNLSLRQSLFGMPDLLRQLASQPPPELPDPLWLLFGLVGYTLVAATGGYLLCRKLDQPLLAFGLAPVIAIVGAGLIWGWSISQANAQVQLRQVSLLSFYTDGSPVGVKSFAITSGADLENYTLELKPNAGSSWLYRPQLLVLNNPQLIAAPPRGFVQSAQANITQIQSTPTNQEGRQQIQAYGGQGLLESRLNTESNFAVLADGSGLGGTVTNTSTWTLNDAALVLADNYLLLGNLAPGQQRKVVFPLPRLSGFLPRPRIEANLYGANLANTDSAKANSTQEQWRRNLHWAALNAAYLNGRFAPQQQSYNLYLTGWVEGQPATALVGAASSANGLSLRQQDTALLIKPLNFSYQPDPTTQKVVVPPSNLIANRLSSNNITLSIDGTLQMAEGGSIVMQYRLPAQLRIEPTIIKILLKAEQEGSAGQAANPQLEIYNWGRQSWELISKADDPRSQLDLNQTNLSRYVEPSGGFLKLRASANNTRYIIRQLNVGLEGVKNTLAVP